MHSCRPLPWARARGPRSGRRHGVFAAELNIRPNPARFIHLQLWPLLFHDLRHLATPVRARIAAATEALFVTPSSMRLAFACWSAVAILASAVFSVGIGLWHGCMASLVAFVLPLVVVLRFRVVPVPVMPVIALLRYRSVRREIRVQLLRAGVPICVVCGYLKKGLPHAQPCPECGRTGPPLEDRL